MLTGSRRPGRRRTLELPIPRPDQAEILDAPERWKVLDAGRRYGKSTLGIPAVLLGHGGGWATGTPLWRGALHGGRLWWVVPDMRKTGRDRWRDLKRATRGVYTRKNETEFRLEFPGGGSIEVRSADDPDSLRGAGLDGIVVDEGSLMPEEVWTEALRAALSDQHGWALFLYTPKGKSHWTWPLFLRGASDALATSVGATADDLEQAERMAGWRSWHRLSSENPLMTEAELAEALLDVGRLRFEQEYLALFVVAGGTVFAQEWVRYYDRAPGGWLVLEGDAPRRVREVALRRRAAIDTAVTTKTLGDYTVICVYAVAPTGELVVLDVERFKAEGPDVVPRLMANWRRWKWSRGVLEAVALGLSMLQDAQRKGLPLTKAPAEKDKVARAMTLAARMEAGYVYFPRSAPWLADSLAELMEFPTGTHDDVVDVLSYAAIDAAARPDSGFSSH
jgi:predicted phage terminase large subunit-like protein